MTVKNDEKILLWSFAGIGAAFLYGGFTGKSILGIIQYAITGNKPSKAKNTQTITGSNVSTPGNPAVLPTPSGTGYYSNAGLRKLWVSAGGNPATAAVAACIAQHESSGNPQVTSSNPDGGTNVGLWQLDTPGGKGAGYSVAQLQNAILNAHVAVKASANGTDWSAWSTAPMCGV